MKKILSLMGIFFLVPVLALAQLQNPHNFKNINGYNESNQSERHYSNAVLGLYATHDSNVILFTDEEELKEDPTTTEQESEDTSLLSKLALSHTYLYNKNIGWNTFAYGKATFYNEYESLNNTYGRIQTGPVVRIPSLGLKFKTQITATNQELNKIPYYKSVGGLFNLHYKITKRTRGIFEYEYDDRTYQNSQVYTLKKVHYTYAAIEHQLDKKQLLSLSTFHITQNTETDIFDSTTLGGGINYIYRWTPNIFTGIGYEYRNIKYTTEVISEKAENNEHYGSTFLGYHLNKHWSLKLSYRYENAKSTDPNYNQNTDSNHRYTAGIILRL